MGIDWQRLIDVRDRHVEAARELVSRHRRAFDEAQAQAQAAQQHLIDQQQARAAHWQAVAGRLDARAVDVSQLRDAGSWSHALDRQIEQATQAAEQAQASTAEPARKLEASRAQLRSSSAALEQARRMRERADQQAQRTLEQRIDDNTEEAATQAWLRRRFT